MSGYPKDIEEANAWIDNAKVSGAGTASAGLPGSAAYHHD